MQFDADLYELHLAAARHTVFRWDPTKHPRDLNGRWREVPDFKDGKLGSVINREAKGLPDNTQDLHTVRDKRGQWHYTKERNQLHKDIVEAYLRDAPGNQERPAILFTAGGSGSGKSSALEQIDDLPPEGSVYIDPDEIKLLIPEYKRLVEEGDPRAMALVHDESIDIAAKLLHYAYEGEYHIAMDGTGASPAFLGRLDTALSRGYEVHVAYFNTDTETALRRIADRKAKTGRGVREDVARDIHRNASRLFERVYETGVSISVYDTTDEKPRLIAEAEAGADIELHDEDAFDAFLGKANETRNTWNHGA